MKSNLLTLLAAAALPLGATAATLAIQGETPPSIERAQMLTSIKAYGAKGDGKSDDTAAIQAAFDRAPVGTTLFFPVGDYVVTRDLRMSADRRISIEGEGQDSLIRLLGAKLEVVGAPDMNMFRIERLRLYRHRAPGTALHINGSFREGVSRFALRDLMVESQAGTAIEVEGAWVGMFDNIIARRSKLGWHFHRDAEAARTSGNGLTIMGGETQGNDNAMLIEAVAGLAITGHSVEYNDRGIATRDSARHVGIDRSYFEANGEYDVQFGGGNTGYGHSVRSSIFFAAGKGADQAILIRKGKNLMVEGNSFAGYRRAAVRLTGEAPASTSATIRASQLSGTPRERIGG